MIGSLGLQLAGALQRVPAALESSARRATPVARRGSSSAHRGIQPGHGVLEEARPRRGDDAGRVSTAPPSPIVM